MSSEGKAKLRKNLFYLILILILLMFGSVLCGGALSFINQPKISTPISQTTNTSAPTFTTQPIDIPLPTKPTNKSVPETPETPETFKPVEMVVPGNAGRGVKFKPTVDGTYIFTIKDGAYSPFNQDGQGTFWRSILKFYVNKEIQWGTNETFKQPNPLNEDIILGCWDKATKNEVVNCSRNLSTTINLKANDELTIIAMEDKNSFDDDRGEVILRIELRQ